MHAIILGGNSDIGKELAKRLFRDGWELTVTYRGEHKPNELRGDGISYLYWNAWEPEDLFLRRIDLWDLLISCVGTMEPIGKWEQQNAVGAEDCMAINLLSPLRGLRCILDTHKPMASIMFFGGANTNSAHPNFFAYSIAKIATIKAMELLDAELPDCKCFAIGPGYIPTKMHDQIRKAGLEPAAKLKGSSHDDLYECLMWAHSQPKSVIGGRNIAVHTDDWRNPKFAERLAVSPDIYKLRRAT